MKRLPVILLSLALAACCAAQKVELRKDKLGLALMLVPKVQTELKLSKSQIALVKKEYEAFQKRAQAVVEAKLTQQQRNAKVEELRATQAKVAVRVLSGLTPAQFTRYQQLTLQAEGIWAVLIPEVSRALKLTATQAAAIRGKRKDFNKKAQDLQDRRRAEIEAVPGPKDPKDKTQVAAYRNKVTAILSKAKDKDRKALAGWARQAVSAAEAVLSAKQKSQWKAMQGPKFRP